MWCIERLRGQNVKVKLQPPTRLFSVQYNLTTFSGTNTLTGVAWRMEVTETGDRDHLPPECLTTLLLRFIFNSPKETQLLNCTPWMCHLTNQETRVYFFPALFGSRTSTVLSLINPKYYSRNARDSELSQYTKEKTDNRNSPASYGSTVTNCVVAWKSTA